MAGGILGGLAGREQGFELTAQPGHIPFGILQVPLGRRLEGHHEALDGVTGRGHDGGAMAMIHLQGQGSGEKAEAILEAGLGGT